MINNLFDKKTAEYEFLSVSTELPFKASDVKLGNDVVYGTPNNAQSINDIFNHLVDNDLYNEQLILNLKENRNVVGAAITGDKERILKYSHDGQKFVLTSNVEPEVRIVKRIVSDANSYVLSVEELKGRRINFILDESQQYVVGTDRGLYCSEDRLSGYHLVTESDYFKESFENFDCKCCIRNYNQGSFHNELDNYQYFLGTNSGVFGLDNSDYFNDTVFWNKLPGIGIASPLSDVNVNCLKLDPVEKVLFVGTDNAIYKVYGNGQNDLNVSEEWYSNQFKTNDIELLESQILRNKNEHILVGSKEGIKQSSNKFFPNDVSLLSTFQERITAFGIDSSLKYIGTNKHLYSFSQNGEYVPIYLSDDENEFEVQDIEIAHPENNLTYEFVVAGNDIWYRSIDEVGESSWTTFMPSDLSGKKIAGISIINNKILLIVDTSANAYWCQFIIDDFYQFSNLDREGTGNEVHDIGDNEKDTGYVGTNKGADVYKFSEGTETKKAFFKIQNNLKYEKITDLFKTENNFIVIQKTNSNSKVWTSKYQSMDYSLQNPIPSSGNVLKIVYDEPYYYIATSSGTYRTINFENYPEIKLGYDEAISSFAFVDEYAVFSTSRNKVYCIPKYEFSDTLVSAFELFSTSKTLDLIDSGISNTFDALDVFLGNENTISQYLIKDKEYPVFEFSLCTNFPLEEERLSASGFLLDKEIGTIRGNSFLSTYLSSMNVLEAFVSITEPSDSENNGQNFIGFINQNNDLKSFHHLNTEQYYNGELDHLKVDGCNNFEYSTKRDLKYLLKDLFLSRNNKFEIYGLRPNNNSIVLYDDARVSAIEINSNYIYTRVSIQTLSSFFSNNNYLLDSNVQIRTNEMANNLNIGSIAFVFSDNTLSILKVGYYEENLSNFYFSNKNYYGTNTDPSIFIPSEDEDESVGYPASCNGMTVGNDGDYNFLENSLSGFNNISLEFGVPVERENYDAFNVYVSNNGLFYTKIIKSDYGNYFNGISNILSGSINCLEYDSNTFYIGTEDKFILTSDEFLGNYFRVSDSLSNCKALIEVSCNSNSVTLIDSIDSNHTVSYSRISPLFLGITEIDNQLKLFVSSKEFLDYYKYDEDETKFVKESDFSSFPDVKKIKKVDDGSILVVFSDNSVIKFSNFGFSEDESISATNTILELNDSISNITDIYSSEYGIIIKNGLDEIWIKEESEEDSEEFFKVEQKLNNVIVVKTKNESDKIFGFYENSTYIFNNSENFVKLFESDSQSEVVDVYKLQTQQLDIFNNIYLFAHKDGSLFVVDEGINSKKFVPIGQNINGKVCSAFDSTGENLLIAATTGNELKIYQTKSLVYDNSSSLISSFILPGNAKDIGVYTINEEPSILVMFNNLFNIQRNISVKRYSFEYDYILSRFLIEECEDSDEDDYKGCLISSVNVPDEWDDVTINSFVDNYEDVNFDINEKLFVSTSKGLAYLKNDGTNSYRLIKAKIQKIEDIENVSNGSYLESDQNIYFGKNRYFGKINKDSLEISNVNLDSNISKILGTNGDTYYFANNSKYALSCIISNWNQSSSIETNGMDFIRDVPMNAMFVSDEPVFGSETSGLYTIQEYKPISSVPSYNILSNFNVDCIEFANEEPIFSMHMICLDLEFDYISSTIDDLTEERLNRVLAIDKISNHEIVILDKDSIRIYDTQISQLIDLDLIKFNSILGGTTVFEMSPIGIDSNGNAYLVVNGSSLFKFNSWIMERVFGNCKGDYKFLNSRFGQNSYVNQIYMIEDNDFFVGVKPPIPRNSEDIISDRKKYSFHSIRDLRMDIALNNENGEMISGDSRAIGDVISDISHGYATKYLFSSGNILYNTFNKIVAEIEVDKIPNDRIITTIFTENDAKYMIGTTNGLYLTNPEFTLDDEMRRNTVDSVTALMADALQVEIRKHLAGSHYGDSMESKFLSVLNSKLSVKPDKIPEWFTSSSKPLAYNSITYISNDIVESMEFNDSNKYVRGSVKNWITDLYGGDSTYSDPGYVDLMTDPIDGSKIDFSDVPYVCKNWNSGLKEFMIYVPTTMTYYINNPKGFSNSIYSDASFPRKNVKNFSTSNIISEKYTSYQLVLDNKHYKISRILLVQINGNSLPLRMYRDDTYCQAGRENLFDTVIQPSEVNSLPIVSNESVNNVSYMSDSSGYLRINFSIYGTDAQSIRILAE